MISKMVEIQLDTFDHDILSKSNAEISAAMNEEIRQLNQALKEAKLETLTPYERAIVKTYIAHKLGLALAK